MCIFLIQNIDFFYMCNMCYNKCYNCTDIVKCLKNNRAIELPAYNGQRDIAPPI